MEIRKRGTWMDKRQAITLGQLLRQRRAELGYSLRTVEQRSGVRNNTISRFEQGEFATPAPEKLARIATALELPLEQVYGAAGYAVPDLPAFKPYLRTKYGELSDDDINAIERYATRLARKRGVSLTGPAQGEDE